MFRSYAKSLTKDKRDEGFYRLGVYKKWFNETILTGKHSNALIVIPQESMAPRYRDEIPEYVTTLDDG